MKKLFGSRKNNQDSIDNIKTYEWDESMMDLDVEDMEEAVEETVSEASREVDEFTTREISYTEEEIRQIQGSYEEEIAELEAGKNAEFSNENVQYQDEDGLEFVDIEQYEGEYTNGEYTNGEYTNEENLEYATGEENMEEYADEEYDSEYDDFVIDEDLEWDMSAKRSEKGFFGKFMELELIDRVIMCTGVVVLILAITFGGMYVYQKMNPDAADALADVGTSLKNIDVIGGRGLLAVADEQKAKQQAAQLIVPIPEEDPEEINPDGEYEEEDYNKTIAISLRLTSVQKDLKIKFVNKQTGKLIANTPFTVTVTNAQNQTEIWVDDDFDGIIYKKDIEGGAYKVAVNDFTDERYKDYVLPIGNQMVEVKKEIVYKKVDVSDEVKKESEINVKAEDTKKNETVEESSLQDTVAWVASTSSQDTFIEVPKSQVIDPALGISAVPPVAKADFASALYGDFKPVAISSSIAPTSSKIPVGDSFTVSAKAIDDKTGEVKLSSITWKSSNPAVATVTGTDANAKVVGVGEGTALISYEGTIASVSGGDAPLKVTGSCNVTVVGGNKAVKVEKEKLTLAMGNSAKLKTEVTGFAEGRALNYKVVGNNDAVAVASVEGNGVVTVKGVSVGEAAFDVIVNYADGQEDTAMKAHFTVSVADKMEILLDQTELVAYVEGVSYVGVTVSNGSGLGVLTVDADAAFVKAEIIDNVLTITGLAEGSTTIVVKYNENGAEVVASLPVFIKNHPKYDTTTKLMDNMGNQLFVVEENKYREAVYADYYTAEKFFIRDEVRYTGWQTIGGRVYYFNAAGEKVLGEQVIQGAKYNFDSEGALVTGSGTLGIDVSKWNGDIDWNAVKNSGVSFVLIRCGYRGSSKGMLVEDPKFAENIKGATNAGLKVGVYFFTQAVDEVEAVYEASFVLDRIRGYRISYPIFLDVEPSGGRGDKIDKTTRTAVCKAFCQTIQNASYTAGVYANKNWLEEKIDPAGLAGYKIWLAQYASTPTYGGRYDLWQYKCKGSITGISGDVDLNLSYLGY